MRQSFLRHALYPLTLASLAACAHPSPTLPSPKSTLAIPGLVFGLVSDAYTGKPIDHAQVTFDSTNISAYTDHTGRYRIGPVPKGTYMVHIRTIGYSPTSLIAAVSDTAPFRLDVKLSYPGAGPPVDTSLFLSTWAAAVRFYHPQEAQHVRDVAGLTGVGRDTTNSDSTPTVLMLEQELRENPFAHRILDSLVALGLASGTCYEDEAVRCPGKWFTTFLALGRPHQTAPDTVAVPLVETAIDIAACREHRESLGGTHSVTLQLARQRSNWAVLGPIGFQISGTVVCAR